MSLKMAKVTLDQKRLEALRRQLYGSQKPINPKKQVKPQTGSAYSLPKESVQAQSQVISSSSMGTESTYLRTDLTKILVLSSLAVIAQLILHWSLQMKLIHLGF